MITDKLTKGLNEMNTYNVFENEKLVATVKAESAEAAIDKVETKRGGHLFNPFAVNTQDANDTYGEEIDNTHSHIEE